jgi:phospholipase/lecithinase/hemolysin
MKFIFSILYIFINYTINTLAITLKGNESSSYHLTTNDKNLFNYDKIKNLIVFGDSLTAYLTNYEDMTYRKKNLGGGDPWSVYLSNMKKMKLWDFADNGAAIDKTIVNVYNDTHNNFNNQCDYFIDKMTVGKQFYNNWNSQDSLFGYFFGTNDLFSLNQELFKDRRNEIIDLFVDSLFNGINMMYQNGARNFMVFKLHAVNENPGVPETYTKTHEIIGKECIRFNERIDSNAIKFYDNHSDANILIYNLNSEMKYINENYADYGFICNNTNYAIKTAGGKKDYKIEDFIMHDKYHPTFKTHKIIADDVNEFLTKVSKISLSKDINIEKKEFNSKTIIYSIIILLSVIFLLIIMIKLKNCLSNKKKKEQYCNLAV